MPEKISSQSELLCTIAGGLNSHSALNRIPRRLILYNVCTADLAFYALREFYAFRKSTTCVSSAPCIGSTPAASITSFIINDLHHMTWAAFRPRHITLSFWDRKLLLLHELEEISTDSVVVTAAHTYR
jgi:hypothetical protein